MEIVFVCTGNTCRSPLAESIAKSLSSTHHFESRGIFALDNQLASFHTRDIIAVQQLPEATLSASFKPEDSKKDLILTMTKSHCDTIRSMYPESNVHTLASYVTGQDKDISDPYGGDASVYQQTYEELHDLITKLVTNLKRI